MAETLKILILDDEPKMGKILARILNREGHRSVSETSPTAALDTLASEHFDLLLTDLKMPEMNGLEVMARAREANPELDFIMMTAYATVETAVDAMKQGATDYLIKPFNNEELIMLAARVAETRGLRLENRELKQSLAEPIDSEGVIAASPAMHDVLKRVEKVSRTDVSVLLRGESGTGKEVMASLVHASGRRSAKPFIKVNCGALTETLLESELFGHVRGAFTGAIETRKGLFLAADGGTLFLDEIGEITPALQVKLLRVLQFGELQRVGDPQTFKVDVRVIAATGRNLEEMIENGEFRSDLYYRLNVVPIVIPPLRERREDIPALIDHFVARLRAKGSKAKRLSAESFDRFMGHDWPGNIRELENAIEHAMVMSEADEIGIEDLPAALQNSTGAIGASALGGRVNLEGMTLEDVERQALLDALESTGFNHTKAASKLGITRRTLGYRVEKLGLPRSKREAEARRTENDGAGNNVGVPAREGSSGGA